MAQPSRLIVAKKDILATLDGAGKTVFTAPEISRLLAANREAWRLAQRTNTDEFIEFLGKQGKLRIIELQSPKYEKQRQRRYGWGEPSPYEVAASIRKGAYLCHGTAVFLHGLTDLIPKIIFVNIEQSPKPPPKGGLTQPAIDRAFANQQRQSNLTFPLNDHVITVLNGKNSKRLGVEPIRGPQGETVDATGLERTLIDIVVRPYYAGGVNEVLTAFRSAKKNVSVNRLIAHLKKLDYVYPYHQAIGFYLQHAGYDASRYEPLRELGLDFDFYLSHGLKKYLYDPAWRIRYPEGLSFDASDTTKSK